MEVVSASHGVLGPLLGKLTDLLARECSRLKDVRREIRSLKSELTGMQAAVQKYSMLQDPDVQAKAWISLVRELAYDTEDVIDKFIHQLVNGGNKSGFKEFFRKTARSLKTLGSRRGIASQIDDLKIRVKEVKDLKDSYKLDDTSCSTNGQHSAMDPRLSALFVEEEHLVGINGPRDDLSSWMLEEQNSSTKHRRVLSIVGFGGLGKTTLAKEVCSKIKGHFHCQAFVSVSQKPNVKKIMRDVISQVPCKEDFTKDIDAWDEKKFITKLRELLQDKRYLIVIDDIWSISAWNDIKYAFPDNNLSSRIIATTRIVEVARSCCLGGNHRTYEMEALSDIHSKNLFFKRIFGSEDGCPDMLKQVSNKILKKCGGLPLAIISVSSLLANRQVIKDEWEKVCRSIGSALDKNRSLEGMNSILSLSYNDLPPNLKTCLLYLSIFPEDYVIERESLVRRWIAEGFISEERGQSKQDVAENHFYELINKSMVQPVDIGYDGKARACQVHDMMLELIISKSVEDNFSSVIGHVQTDSAKRQGLVRRLSVQHIDQELSSVLANEDLSHVRSLTVTTQSCMKLLPSLVKFEALRVLDFQGCQGLEEYDMNGIDKLFQLKYLSLRSTDISMLPSGIVRLYDLETLDLSNTYIEELPSGIVQLTRLQYLLIGGSVVWSCFGNSNTKIPNGIRNMSNLQVITGFNISNSSLGAVEELGNLTGLNELHLQLDGQGSQKFKRHEEMLLSSLCKLGSCKLQSLWICSNDSTTLQFLDSWSPLPSSLQRFRMTTNYFLPKVPKWIAPALHSLAYLNINLEKATEEDLRILGEMPALISLEITFRTVQIERLTIRSNGFPCLKELYIEPSFKAENVTNLLFEEGALPKLEKLDLPFSVSVGKAYGFHLGIGHLTCLKHAAIDLWDNGASASENRAAAAAIRNEANAHSNHLRLIIYGESVEEEIDTYEEENKERSMEVVSASHGALGPLLGKLTALLAGECSRLKGVRREIRSLKSELTSMQAAVQKYSMLQDPDVQAKAWISLVRELAYDTEDVIDKFIHQLGNGGNKSGFTEFFRKTARSLKTLGSRRGIASQIDDLKIRAKEVKDLKDSYKLDDTACSTKEHSAMDPRLSSLFVEEAHLVGIDGPRDDLSSWMLEEQNSSTKHCRVLSIVGFGGLGKTTLAKEVSSKIKGHFDCHAFVSVSQKPNVKKIIKDVISHLPCKEDFTKDIDAWDQMKFIAKLRELLQDKRYLIVIDDIWSISAWDSIKYAFPENNLSSRIITTTRIVEVARSCCWDGNDRMYEMEALSDIHSKKLFFKRIFGSEKGCPDMLEHVSNKILKKCGGLPLAIISVSSLLANKPVVKDEWEKVSKSIGFELDKNRSLEGMNNILSLSYNDLPPDLKTCLLYLSIFPEDYEIERESFVRRWIAEGFVCEEHGLSKQEVAENHFYELINKSMIQPVDIGYDGKARACQVHDMMLELIISKSIEDNFTSVIGHWQTDSAKRQGLIRRLSVQHIDQELASVLADEDLSHVRSLTVTTPSFMKYLPSLAEFETLRVLDFQGCEGLEEYDMNGIDKLFHLKYLSLRGTGMSKLPSGIVKLYGLETLDIRDTYIEELPSRIVQLTKLQYLLIGTPHSNGFVDDVAIPNGIGNMSNLRIIMGFNITKSSLGAVEELGNLAGLNELHLQLDGQGSQEFKRHEEMLLSTLCKLGSCKLQSLWIYSDHSTPLQFLDSWSPLPSSLQRFGMVTSYYLPKIPKWIAPALDSLAYLDINLVKATEEDLGIVGEMPALISLVLTFITDQEERLTIRGIGFPCLKELSIESGGANLLFEEGALPKLEKLKLPFFASLAKGYGFHLGISHLTCLKHATISLWNYASAASEYRAAAAAIRNEANAHSNHPRIIIK
ncbi:hypothetical protein U9M48_038665 [Paspalum notatum var. saurae]|uniref:Disease resistance protein RPM1 n=1 Tax=Paspalum notatum var. saurae TaxID=547442 RepID=A0AAQ3XAJ7_PASNO